MIFLLVLILFIVSIPYVLKGINLFQKWQQQREEIKINKAREIKEEKAIKLQEDYLEKYESFRSKVIYNYNLNRKRIGNPAQIQYERQKEPFKNVLFAVRTTEEEKPPSRPSSQREIEGGRGRTFELETGEECASYHLRLSTVDFALDLEKIGLWYNKATIAVERGGGPEEAEGGTVILTLVQNSYPAIYKHKEWFGRLS